MLKRFGNLLLKQRVQQKNIYKFISQKKNIVIKQKQKGPLNEEINQIFSKITKASSQRDPFLVTNVFQQQEEEAKKTNVTVLLRELKNDTFQLPLKTLAFYYSPASVSATFWAELIRSLIDTINHLILFGTNYVPIEPSLKYPYGMEKLKNVVVIIPAALFTIFGIEIIYESIQSLCSVQSAAVPHIDSTLSLFLYILSITIEINVIKRNILDAQKVDTQQEIQGDEEGGKKKSLLKSIKELFSKKDPLLQAILYENAITFTSTSIPLLCQLLTMLYPTSMFEIVGSSIIGLIQIYLGYHLGKRNLSSLVGEEGLDIQTLNHVVQIIRKNQFIKEVADEKAVMIGPRKFRFFAEVTFDMNQLNKSIITEYQQIMEKIIYYDSYVTREQILIDLISSVPKRVMLEIQKNLRAVEVSIMQDYPNCTYVDLEIRHSQLLQLYDNLDKIRDLYKVSLRFDQNFLDWIKDQADYLLKKQFQSQQQKTRSQENILLLTAEDYKKSYEHYNNQISRDHVEEFIYLYDDRRFENITNQEQNAF